MKTARRYWLMAAAAGLLIAAALVGVQARDQDEPGAIEPRQRHEMGRGQMQRDQFTPELADSSALIGTTVTNSQGEKLGEIEDIVLNRQRDGVSYAALQYGDAIGIGGKHFAVPWRSLTIQSSSRDKVDKVLLNVRRDEFEKAEGFSTDDWPNEGDRQWARTAAAVKRDEHEPSEKMTEGRREDQKEEAAHSMQYRRLTHINGLEVKDTADTDMGSIEDTVLDMTEGRPVFAVISFGGTLGLGEKMATMPWSAVDIVPSQEIARVDVQKDTLQATAYEPDNPPKFASRDEIQRLYERFDEQPYWQIFGYVEPSETERAAAEKPWQADSEYCKKFDASKLVSSKRGTVQSVGAFQPAPKANPGLRLVIETSDGKTHTIHAGPREYARSKGFQFEEGDQIHVTGSQVEIEEGREVIVATELRREGKTLELRSKQGKPKWTTAESLKDYEKSQKSEDYDRSTEKNQ